MISCAACIASITRREVLTIAMFIAIAVAIRHAPARANLTPVTLEEIREQQIGNENARHKSVMNEITYEQTMARKKLTDQLQICTTAACKEAQRADELRTQNQLDVREDQENAAHAKKLAQINASIAAEEKANPSVWRAGTPPH